MVFSDLFFIFVFLPFFALSYIAGNFFDKARIRRHEEAGTATSRPMMWRNTALMIFSLLFYAWGEPVYVLLMLLSVCLNYFSGLVIAGFSGRIARKTALTIGVALNLAILGSFKYLGFFCGILNDAGVALLVPEVALPIGISFYIFQSISYLVDVYRKETPVQRNFFDLLLYIAMFPQLIAGPIVRYGTVADEINHRTVSEGDLAAGSYRFFIGLAKKVIFANILGEIATQLLGGDITDLSAVGAWVGILAFTLQIYFDFSGYSDMAIGMGRCVGFHFPENFSHPYIATSMTDFWRRWHISLGSFFRDYVYIPMGGNRRHQMLNILTVWFLTGMWHGASWNFIIWGLYYGLIITLEKYTLLRYNVPRVFSHIYSLFLILVGWGIFYFDDPTRLVQFFHAFFGLNPSQGFPLEVESLISDNFWLIIAALAFCLPIRTKVAGWCDRLATSGRWTIGSYTLLLSRAVIAAAILAVCVALLIGATNNAFIYTRF